MTNQTCGCASPANTNPAVAACRHYRIRKAAQRPVLTGAWDHPSWADVPALAVDHFYDIPGRSSDHRPRTQARVLYDHQGLYVFFRVEDRFVRSVATEYQAQVCQDSCVEFFVQPRPDRGYFNFEINCGGTLLLYYVTDYDDNGRFKNPVQVEPRWLDRVEIHGTMPRIVNPELPGPITWTICCAIPFAVLRAYAGDVAPAATGWRGNFYKCADRTSHPHWASWAPVDGSLSFHKPRCFAPLSFEL